jgi:hypothetical protein
MKLRSGTILVVVLIAVLTGGWLVYRHLIPPRWLHNFAVEIALRATPDPNAPPPEDVRQATPRGLASHPYICMRAVVPFAWNRLIIVPSGGDPRDNGILRNAEWPDKGLTRFAALLSHDPRYQLIVLLQDGRVVGDDLFFTFWADLSALGQPDGYTPETAIFTAAVHNGHYVLSPVPPPYPQVCG